MEFKSLLESSTNSQRQYKCMYCSKSYTRSKLVDHIDEKHEDLIPNGYSASRLVFNMINKKDHGTCTVCGKESPWNEDKGRYDRICSNPDCKKKYIKMTEERLMKARGVTKQDLLNDPDFQEKMLENRGISGKYKFQDGTYKTYTGTYEKKFLEFLDVFLHINPVDIYSPGPVIEYEYEGKKHKWITDFYYEPYNLVFDIKDGGDNPNNRSMVHYRAKQIEKEKAIKKLNKYNYIRLTNNNFEQLVLLMMELKELYLDNNKEDTHIIRINESSVAITESKEYDSYHDQLYLVEYSIKEMNTEERNKLPDSAFGIPSKRKYPLDTEAHTRSAIKFFNYCNEEDEKELAENIIKAMKKFNITDIKVSNKNRFSKYYKPINESYIKNEQDIYYNKDKFDSGEINLCFITGLSGSGKSTMGHKIEKDNVDCIELDDLLVIKDRFSMDNLKEYSDLIYSFFNSKGKKWYMGYNDLMKLPKEDPYEDQLFIDFINYAISYSKSHKNKKYVLEGVWIFKYMKPEQLKNFAVYIKGTSMIVSKIRAAKRDSRDGETKFERTKAFTKGIFRNLKWYLIDEKQVQKFRDYYSKLIGENNISESSKKILNDKGEKVPEKCTKCGADVKIYIKGEPVYLCSNEKCNKYFGTVPFVKEDTAATNVMVGTASPIYTNNLQNMSFSKKDGKRYAICKQFMTDLVLLDDDEVESLEDFIEYATDIKMYRIGDSITESTMNDYTEVYPYSNTLTDIRESFESTLLDGYNQLGIESVPIFTLNESMENTNIRYYRDLNGVFIKNIDTGFRSKSFNDEKDITAELKQLVSKSAI